MQDIASCNVMVSRDLTCKLADFGVCCKLINGEYDTKRVRTTCISM